MEKIAENCKISQKIGVSRQILDKMDIQLCENLHCLKDILINFHIFFISWKNLVWFLSYVNLKFRISGVPLKIVNLPFWKFICACNIGQKGHALFWKNGNQKYHHLLVQCQSIFYVFCLKIKLYIVFPKEPVSDCWTHKMSRFGPGDKICFLMLSKS